MSKNRKLWTVLRLGFIGASLYYGGRRELPPVLQGITAITTLTALIASVNDLFEEG